MKIKLLSSWLFVMLLGFSAFSQSTGLLPKGHFELNKATPTLSFPQPDMAAISQEDAQREKNGQLYRIGIAAYTSVTTSNSGSWTTKPNGDRVWQLHIGFEGAEALSFLFQTFKIYDDARFDVFGTDGKKVAETLTQADVMEHFQKNIPLCFGDEMTLQLTEPAGTRPSEILLDQIMYGYRGTGNPHKNEKDFNDSESCEINVNCTPVGDAWQDEKRGIARILVTDSGLQGWCTGSLVNNTAQNCKPYFLTAQHCGVTSSTSDFNQWIFYFGYEATGCTDPSNDNTINTSAKRITGCVLVSRSAGVNGNSITSSDFILVQLGTLAGEAAIITKLKTAAINAYWNGWDANNVANTGGAGIHHPAGDIKKISTYSGSLVSTNYSAGGSNTHWRVTWTSNSNGHGVTEGGSSGSPIFNNNGGNSRIIGTLSGGSSYCSALSSPDLYGKLSYHWTSNGTTSDRQLKPFLDPASTNVLVLNGSSNPCGASTPVAPVAQFTGSPTTVNVGGVVTFTDQSSNTPVSWSWTITPATGWAYASGTNANSQNPQVTFNVQGQYTVSLTATNGAGSDVEIKTNYITVTVANGPCTASSATCDEYISNVTLAAINNSTLCTNYGDYTAQSATLTRGQSYTATLTLGQAYNNDEVAIYIDWNADLDFNDLGERVGYALVEDGWNNQFSFLVPFTAATGAVRMRVRMSYNGASVPDPDGPIMPCGQTNYGEVEDYTINVIALVGLDDLSGLAAVTVFPNPVNEQLTVDLSATTGTVDVELTDLAGKVLEVHKNVAGTVTQFDMTHIAKGMYQVRLSNETTRVIRKVTKL